MIQRQLLQILGINHDDARILCKIHIHDLLIAGKMDSSIREGDSISVCFLRSKNKIVESSNRLFLGHDRTSEITTFTFNETIALILKLHEVSPGKYKSKKTTIILRRLKPNTTNEFVDIGTIKLNINEYFQDPIYNKGNLIKNGVEEIQKFGSYGPTQKLSLRFTISTEPISITPGTPNTANSVAPPSVIFGLDRRTSGMLVRSRSEYTSLSGCSISSEERTQRMRLRDATDKLSSSSSPNALPMHFLCCSD